MRKYIILYTGLLLSVSGCSLLELDESTGLNREEAIPTLAMSRAWLLMFIASCPDISECSTGL